jgi:hypothetical protein
MPPIKREEIVYQEGYSEGEYEALKRAYYDSEDDDIEYPKLQYRIVAHNDSLVIDNQCFYDESSYVNIYGNDRMIVLFALAEMLGYDLIKKEDNNNG